MSVEELKEKQKLAVDLYNLANGHVKYKSIKHCQHDILEKLTDLAGNDTIIVDLSEQKIN